MARNHDERLHINKYGIIIASSNKTISGHLFNSVIGNWSSFALIHYPRSSCNFQKMVGDPWPKMLFTVEVEKNAFFFVLVSWYFVFLVFFGFFFSMTN